MLTASTHTHRAAFDWLVAVLIMAALLGACRKAQTGGDRIGPHPSPAPSVFVQPVVQPIGQPMIELTFKPAVKPTVEPIVHPQIPGPLIDPTLDLRAGPVSIPLELRIPSLQINASMLGVGITGADVMDAPQGLAGDPVWQQAFWYRGSGIPGDLGTATLAGHVDDVLGRPALFAHLKELKPGDLVVIHDPRSGLDVRFTVVKTATYSTQQAGDPTVLAEIYGSGPVAGLGPQPAPDGLAHLTLITCAGGFVNGFYDRRLVVYASRSE